MKKYRHLFFDLDHTLWDFDANARHTLEQLHRDLRLPERGITDFDRFHNNYLAHNAKLWDRYRKGYIKQDELRLKRMWLCLLDFQIADDDLAREMSDLFLQLLPSRTLLFPDTLEVLQYLKDKGYVLHIITNGFEHTQHTKLQSSGLAPFFNAVITSEGSGSLKPQKAIFDFALQQAGAVAEESVMIGDNFEVDILGARDAGWDQVYALFTDTPQEGEATYVIRKLRELEEIF